MPKPASYIICSFCTVALAPDFTTNKSSREAPSEAYKYAGVKLEVDAWRMMSESSVLSQATTIAPPEPVFEIGILWRKVLPSKCMPPHISVSLLSLTVDLK